MKRIIIIVAALLLTIPTAKAQKEEIKKAQKEVKAKNFASAASYLSQAKRIFAAADRKTRSEYYVTEAELRLAEKKLDANQIEMISISIKRANSYELTSSLRERISQINLKIKGSTATIADSEFNNENYSTAAALYSTLYSSSKDKIYLLKAARSNLLAEEFNESFNAYRDLLNSGYTNAKNQFVATDVKTNKKAAFTSAAKRDEAISQGLFKKPETIATNSKLPEILRGITQASIPLNKKYEVVSIIDRAIAKEPENKVLLNQVSHLYKQLDAHDKYMAALDQLIEETPNDPNLYYNSALASAENNDLDRAMKFYKKALEVDSDYLNAKVNISVMLLDQEKEINFEMNELGTSEEDDARYEVLKQKRMDLYREVLPYLNSIVMSQPQNREFSRKLKSINSFIGNDTQIAIETMQDY